jgi:hypothetical protein
MSATEFPEYLRRIQNVLNEVIAAGQAVMLQFQADQRSITRGFIAGILLFMDDTELHFREYLDLNALEPRQMYAYHYQSADGRLIFRYDNAVHRPPLAGREHKHTPDVIIVTPSPTPTLEQVIDEILHRQRP